MTSPRYRAVELWHPRLVDERRADGSWLLWQEEPLGPYPRCLSDRILHWAAQVPERTWMAERDATGGWRRVSYGQLGGLLGRVGSFLIGLGLSVERPLMILSGNSIEHAVLALGAQHVGIPSAAVAPAYALIGDATKLAAVAGQVTPGAVFAGDLDKFGPAIARVFGPDVTVIGLGGSLPDRRVFGWSQVIGTDVSDTARARAAAVDGDAVAKFLFTSGTTGAPKAVIQTQRMLCSNMEMVRDCYAYLTDEPPVLVDWAPWNHVASGTKVFNMALYNGGTYYIDAGNPSPKGIQETIRNLREISPTWYFNVPAGYEMLVEAMETDAALAQTFYKDAKLLLYAGAGMAKHTWDGLERLSERTIGARTLLCAGLGSTETAPFALFCTDPQSGPGNIGIPAKGLVIKLVPTEGKLELHVKGPSVTPGYWRAPELAAQVFDAEGFYNMGDAVVPVDATDPAKGFRFDGRTAENFKLNTGTWVAVGTLRAALIDAMGGLIRDAVLAGEGEAELGALMVPFRPGLERLLPEGTELSDAALYAHPVVAAELARRLGAFAAQATGSSNRVARATLLVEPLRLEKGEVTDKGSINQRAVLRQRPEAVAALFAGGKGVIVAAAQTGNQTVVGERDET
ncbi:MAG: feruloyl-CoA synthase [bacterium]